MSCVRFVKQGATLTCLEGSTPILYIYSNGNVVVPCADGGVGYVGGSAAKALLQMGADPSWMRYGDVAYGLPTAARLWRTFYKDETLAAPVSRPKKVLEIRPPPAPKEAAASKASEAASKDGASKDDFEDKCIMCLKEDRDAVLRCGHATMCKACHYLWMFNKALKGKSAPACNLCNAPVGEECARRGCNRPWSHELACGCRLCALCVLRSWDLRDPKNVGMDCRCCSTPTYSVSSRHVTKARP